MKRIFAFLLAMVLFLGSIPMHAVHVHAAEAELSASEVSAAPDPGLPDNEELFEAYAQQLFYGNNVAFFGSAAGERLSGDAKVLYDALVPYIKQIAAGQRASTIIGIGQTVEYDGDTYTADVAATFTDVKLSNDTLGTVMDALQADLPYEMYWYDKKTGVKTFVLSGSTIVHAQIKLTVADNYSTGGDYTADTAKTGAAAKAAANAKTIVSAYAAESDYEKLVGYKQAICDLVSYNYTAAGSGTFSQNNDPWQLIYVFDGDSSTNVVCEGYSKAFMYLCDLTDFSGAVSCYTVSGDMNGEGHMWNIVTIGGKNYLADVTDSDTGTIGADGSYFLAGATGSPTAGYTVASTTYTYDADTLSTWGTGASSILTLAASSYVPGEDPCKQGHVGNVEIRDAVEATCTSDGYSGDIYCLVCGNLFAAGVVLEKTGHVYTTVTTAPTCTANGVTTQTCSVCGDSYIEMIAATGHSYTAVVSAPTCTENGYTTHTCSVCGDSYTDTPVAKLGHDLGAWTTTKDATCTEAGQQRRDCSRCDYYETQAIAATGHTYSAVVTAPTCTKDGYTTHMCSACGDSYTDTPVAKLGHNMGQWAQVTAPTATTEGEDRRDCSRCDHYEIRIVAATGHQYIAQVIAPTCTEAGYTKYTCAECGDSYTDTPVTKLGHDLGAWTTTKGATCTEAGQQRRDCSRCDYYESYTIAAMGHNYESIEKAPTCTESGYITYTCSECGNSYKEAGAAALGHNYKNGSCSVCGAQDPNYTTLKITTQPTDVTVAAGSKIRVKVVAEGEGLTYTWYYKSKSASKYTKSSVTSATYSATMKASYDGRQMYCVVTDKYGNSVQSDVITLHLASGVKITTQPASVTVAAGSKIRVKVVAEGEGLTYKWYYKNAGASKFSKSSVTSAAYSATMKKTYDGRQMYCVVTDKYGNSVKSNVITVKLASGVKITTQPASVTVAAGSKIRVKVVAEGEGLTYRWYYKNAGASKFSKSSITSATYSATMKASYDGRQMYCIVTDKYGNSVKSDVVTIRLASSVKITTQPASVTVAAGSKIKVKVVAEGEGLTYKWYYKNAGASKFSKSSVTSAAYSATMKASYDGRQMYCIVTDKYGNSVKSDIVTIYVK